MVVLLSDKIAASLSERIVMFVSHSPRVSSKIECLYIVATSNYLFILDDILSTTCGKYMITATAVLADLELTPERVMNKTRWQTVVY
jgi:hypothetical protein